MDRLKRVAGFSRPSPGYSYASNFCERVRVLAEQLSRTQLLLPLCTTGILVNDGGRSLSLSDLIVEIRSEFDALARAQLELLIDDAPA